ncbi:MAG: hypothetical protein K1X94_15980 [Sandaracinaceae bacterium]|nr:hypothetical protein [Sandaracinaceae bacterium]
MSTRPGERAGTRAKGVGRLLRGALACLALSSIASTCDRRTGTEREPLLEGTSEAQAQPLPDPEGARRPPTGTTCGGRDDCPSDQVCVESRCRYRLTSVAGEILASSARALVEAGDWEGAITAYSDAVDAYVAAHAPVPADLLCEQATLMLSTATTPDAREAGAVRADACFRASLPGFGPREETRRAVARLRFQGLDVTLFDQETPATRFFTQAQSPPTVDAIVVEATLTGEDQPGLVDVRTQIDAEAAHRAIAECFIQDWEVRHERAARGALVVRYSTRMRDMGTYDSFEPELLVEKTTVAEDGFEPCVARALSANLTAPRSGRVVSWQAPLEVSAHVQ